MANIVHLIIASTSYIRQVSKDERSDVESSSEDEISEQEELCKKAPYNTKTTNGHLKN